MSDEPRELSGKALGYWAGRLGIDRAPGETDDQLRARAARCALFTAGAFLMKATGLL